MAAGSSPRIIKSNQNRIVPFDSPEDAIEWEGLYAEGSGTNSIDLVLTDDIPASTQFESVVLIMGITVFPVAAQLSVVTSATITDDSDTEENACYNPDCYPDWTKADMEEANSFGNAQPPLLYYKLATKQYLAGTTFNVALTGSINAAYAWLAVVTRGKANQSQNPLDPQHSFQLTADGLFSNFYGARYAGKGGLGEDGDDCIGGEVSLDTPHNAIDAGPFDIGEDIGLVISATRAYGLTNPDSLLFFYTTFDAKFDQGWPTWDFTEIQRYDSGDIYDGTEFAPDPDFDYNDRLVWGYRLISPYGSGPVSFHTQWNCPGSRTFGSGPFITLYKDVRGLAQYVATMAGGNGAACCMRPIIVADNVRVHDDQTDN